ECPNLAVVCGSASKAYAMTGWRCGWSIAPPDVTAAAGALQRHATANVNPLAQKAALAAPSGADASPPALLAEYRKRRDNLYGWLTVELRLKCSKPAGAFYLFVDIGDVLALDGIRTSTNFARMLLDEARVAVTPGEAFDAPGFIRISYANSMENLREGSRRLLDFVSAHAPGSAVPG